MYPTNDYKSRGCMAGSRSRAIANTGMVVSGGSSVDYNDDTIDCLGGAGVAE